MNSLVTMLGIVDAISGVLAILLALPLLRGKVKRNPFYGVRFPAAFRSEDAWLEINRFGARRLIAWSIPLILLGLAAPVLPREHRDWAIWVFSLAPLIFLIPAFESWRYASRVGSRP